ncbi:MAG: MoaD/ThiS family protein [Dehalococcoidales bacterium]|jgi:molybdopterin converting factor small subunit|nr:MoaD/ThiS family protein [Dehalococcoidales bacterium]
MGVKVVIPESFQVASGGLQEVEAEGKTIGECLREAVGKAPGLQKVWFTPEGGLSKYVVIFLNSENVPGNDLNREVKDGDEIMPLLLVGGG